MKSRFEKRFLAFIRKRGSFVTASLAILSIFSIFTVHVAGFLFRVPSEFRILIDSYFISNLIIQFSVITALAALAARLSPALIASTYPILILVFTYAHNLSKSSQRRIRAIGLREINSWLQKSAKKSDADTAKLSKVRNIDRHVISNQLRAGRNIITRNAFISAQAFTQRYRFALSFMSVVIVFSTLYIPLVSIIAIPIVLLSIWIISPPNILISKGFEVRTLKDVMLLSQRRGTELMPIGKIVILLLAASFLIGSLHHKRVIGRDGLTGFGESDDQPSNIVLITSTGVLVHSEEKGYRFFSSQLATGSSVFGIPDKQ